jgi:hypothetical protein
MVVVLGGVIAALALGLALLWPRSAPPSVSVTFSRYGKNPTSLYPVERSGIFVIRNDGLKRVVCRGVGASSEQQITQVLGSNGWTNTEHPWLSPGSAVFDLEPGKDREVSILVETNLSWRVAFRFRDRGFVDSCPWYVWRLIPAKLRRVPSFREIWTEPVPPAR